MRGILKAALALFFFALCLPAQERGRPDSGSSAGTSSGGERGVSTATATPTVSSSTSSYDSRGVSVTDFGSASLPSGGSGFRYTPNLYGTSFQNADYYWQFVDFTYWLRMRYGLNPLYFMRFYRNVEPLVTPRMQRLALREPLALSTEMLQAIDELQAMLAAPAENGTVNKAAIALKTQQIRDLARKIRKDPMLSYVDLRPDRNIAGSRDVDHLGLAAIDRLREWALDLNNQLKAMYSQSETATTSVDSLSQPSFDSLAKGIEKAARVIENRSRKL